MLTSKDLSFFVFMAVFSWLLISSWHLLEYLQAGYQHFFSFKTIEETTIPNWLQNHKKPKFIGVNNLTDEDLYLRVISEKYNNFF